MPQKAHGPLSLIETPPQPIGRAAFYLPRFTVTSKTDQTYYRPGDKPIIEGAATFSSGAPVQKATVKVKWSMENDTSG